VASVCSVYWYQFRSGSKFTSEPMIPGDSLIIFDEIQACERALTSLKYFTEEAPEYHIAAAGSLLGVSINRKSHSFPVGKIQFLTMHPLDFEEFLLARGKNQSVSVIRDSYESNEPYSLHETFLDDYRVFIGVGGMPQVVNEFIKTKDYNMVMAMQRNIIDAYIADMAKYAGPSETAKIIAAFKSVPSQLAKENRKFQYKIIKSGARAVHYELALDWLSASAMVKKCIKVSQGRVPLNAFAEPVSFKLYMADTGLLCAGYGISPEVFQSESPAWQAIKGALTENYVASALVSNGYTPYYWESEGKAEIDFLIQTQNGAVIPVEVKSAENVRSKSLSQFISRFTPQFSIRISAKNFGFENKIKSIPLYAVFCIDY
ncbi:MAG: DUF4143 domain-containing protein, partial [Bacteroidota bacterium]